MFTSPKRIFLTLTLILAAFFSSIIHEHEIASRFSYMDSGTPITIERVESNSVNYNLCFSQLDDQVAQNKPINSSHIFTSPLFLQYPPLYQVRSFYLLPVQLRDFNLIISFLQRSKPWHYAGDDDPAVC